jgi:hypothetical protein
MLDDDPSIGMRVLLEDRLDHFAVSHEDHSAVEFPHSFDRSLDDCVRGVIPSHGVHCYLQCSVSKGLLNLFDLQHFPAPVMAAMPAHPVGDLRFTALGTQTRSGGIKGVVGPPPSRAGFRLFLLGNWHYSLLYVDITSPCRVGSILLFFHLLPQPKEFAPSAVLILGNASAGTPAPVLITLRTDPLAALPADRFHGNGEGYLFGDEVAQIQGVPPEEFHIKVVGNQFHLLDRPFKVPDRAKFDVDLFPYIQGKTLQTAGTPNPDLPCDSSAHEELGTDLYYVKGTGHRSLDIQLPDRWIFLIHADLNIHSLREDIIEEKPHPHPPKPNGNNYRMNIALSIKEPGHGKTIENRELWIENRPEISDS